MADCNDSIESKNTSNLISISNSISTTNLDRNSFYVPVSNADANLTGATNFAYSPNIQWHQLNAIQANFEKNAFYVPASNKFVDLFGQEVFNQSLIAFNNFLSTANINPNLNLPVNYPLVQDRINRGVAITPVELTIFMEDSGYNPVSVQAAITTGPRNVLSLYNTNINGNFSKSTMGAFCELAPSIFGAVAGFFTAIGAIASKIADIINKIQNFSLAFLLDSLKKKITDVIEKSIEKVKKIIENFTLDGLISQAQQYFQQNVLAKFEIIKQNALTFFEENNIESFKKRIDGLISYATGIFKDIKLEEIQFLIYRFCSFITQVEGMINGLKNPLDAFSNRYVYAGNILQSNSSVNTLSAVANGAKRPGPEDVAAAIAAGVSAESIRGNQPPPSSEEYKNLPQWNGGKGDSRVEYRGNWVKPRESGGMGEQGWNMPNSQTNLDAKVYLMRVHTAFAARTGINRLIIKSAYRDPAYNANTKGAAAKSNHMSGHAFDIGWDSYPNNRDIFIEIARSYGFKGIGIYPTFTHIDRRATDYSWRG